MNQQPGDRIQSAAPRHTGIAVQQSRLCHTKVILTVVCQRYLKVSLAFGKENNSHPSSTNSSQMIYPEDWMSGTSL